MLCVQEKLVPCGPRSPLPASLLPDDLEMEPARRGHRFCRDV